MRRVREFTPLARKISRWPFRRAELEYHRQHDCTVLDMTRVLLVEDAEDVLYLLRLQLEWMGYVVTAATNAKAGLDAAQQLPPQVIISDLRMPEIDGFEFIRRVRAIPSLKRVPAIAVTGSSADSEIQLAINSGFTAHLTKPVEVNDLSTMIQRLTARYVQRKAG